MRYFSLVTFTLLTLNSISQKSLSAYIEVRGSIDILGNIYLEKPIKPKKLSKTDSLVDFSQIASITKLHEPIKVINKLSENGWALVTVTQVSGDKENKASSSFILYYFRKEFEL
jgi:hypothetical protein